MKSEYWHLIRKRYEFSKETKLKRLKEAGFKCEECGVAKNKTKEGYLEIHHLLPIWFVVNYFPQLSEELVKSLENAQCLCKDCHDKKHNKTSIAELSLIAQNLLGVKTT